MREKVAQTTGLSAQMREKVAQTTGLSAQIREKVAQLTALFMIYYLKSFFL